MTDMIFRMVLIGCTVQYADGENKYCEDLLGHPIFTHQFPMYEKEIKERSFEDFKELCACSTFEPHWIPVTERLPDEDYCTGRGIQHSESVLVTIVNHANDDDVFVDMACTVDGKWQLTYPIDDDPDIPKWCEIVAWMPLPEPYEE